MKVMTILGTRPEIIRLSRIIPKLDNLCTHILVNTRQNYDDNLNALFFNQLGLRQPDHNMSVPVHIGNILTDIDIIIHKEEFLNQAKPDKVLILGDTNSGLSAVVAKRMGIPVYHMEAGNRCFDDRTPEETNRRIIDHCSDILMPYTERSRANLLREGIESNRIYVTGNPIYEVIKYYSKPISSSLILNELHLEKDKYFLVTAHRQENVNNRERLASIIDACNRLFDEYGYPIVFSRHPNTINKMKEWDIDSNVIMFHEPFGFFDFITLEKNALCVVTDSGTVQEECCILKVPNVTIRDNTERPETIECGSNILAGIEPGKVLTAIKTQMALNTPWQPPQGYLDDNVSDKVVKIIMGV